MMTFRNSLILSAVLLAVACTPTIQLDTPKQGITINMNVVVDHNISVKMDEQTQKAVEDVNGKDKNKKGNQ